MLLSNNDLECIFFLYSKKKQQLIIFDFAQNVQVYLFIYLFLSNILNFKNQTKI
jgi:hypothetical protein